MLSYLGETYVKGLAALCPRTELDAHIWANTAGVAPALTDHWNPTLSMKQEHKNIGEVATELIRQIVWTVWLFCVFLDYFWITREDMKGRCEIIEL
jgi:hypothetical protein